MHRIILMLLLLAAVVDAGLAEEIPLTTCDGLPVVPVSISGMKFSFLLDTAATSMLNLKSFAYGDARKVSVTSWSGTAEAKGQQVTINDMVVGEHHLRNLALSAIDLSGIGRACGRQLDGVLGIDLLRKLGAVLDLKDGAARLLVGAENAKSRVAELDERLVSCGEAFNRADEKAFADCLDPEVVLFTAAGDFHGREASMEYYRQKYLHQPPPVQLSITPRAHHFFGEAMWVEYDLRATVAHQVIEARGTALFRKTDGKWRIIHLDHSSPATVAFADAGP